MESIIVKCKGADTLPIDRILEFQGGLKELSKENEKKLRNSILKFGFIAPLFLWDDQGEWRLLDGHQRLKTLLKMREEGYDIPLLPVDYIEADSEEDAKRKLLHITSQYGEFTLDGFENFTFDLDGFEDIRLTNDEFFFKTKEEEGVVEDDYEIPEEIETDIQVGDVFEIGEHRLMCGDSTDAEMVSKLMDGQKADMVFTDPPWNVNYGAVEENNPMGYKPRTILNDFMGTEDFKKFMYDTFKNMNTYSKKGCMTYVVMSAQEWGNMMLALTDNGFHWSSTIIWNKDRLVMSRKDYHTKYEPIWYGWKEGASRLKPLDDRKQSDVWDIDRPSVSELHPTMKPIELVAKAIKNSSNQGDVVLDLFGGSGSTLIACEQLNRSCYMMELDPKYCHVIIDRMRELDGTIEIRRNGELYD